MSQVIRDDGADLGLAEDDVCVWGRTLEDIWLSDYEENVLGFAYRHARHASYWTQAWNTAQLLNRLLLSKCRANWVHYSVLIGTLLLYRSLMTQALKYTVTELNYTLAH